MKQIISSTLLIACTLLVSSAVAGGDNPLDAPIVSKPTVRSEISRGHDAAFEFTLKASTLRLEQASDCVDRAQAENRQKMGTGYEAFATGCYFTAWNYFRTSAAVLKNSTIGDSDTAARKAEYYWKLYSLTLKGLGLSDDAAIEAMSDYKPSVMKAAVAEARKQYGD